LKECRDPGAGKESSEPVPQCDPEQAAQVRPERANDPAADHVQAPEQQGNPSHQIQEDDASHRCLPSTSGAYGWTTIAIKMSARSSR
jgi:hypothetical protein